MTTDHPMQTPTDAPPDPGTIQALPPDRDRPTPDDPTAGGWLCGARRAAGQVESDRARGIDNPWLWCRNRAGWKTGHVGRGRCANHGGAAPQVEQREARLRLVEMVGPALATLARVMTDPDASASARVRAAEAVLDRSGYPRRHEVSVEEGRQSILARIEQAQQADEAAN